MRMFEMVQGITSVEPGLKLMIVTPRVEKRLLDQLKLVIAGKHPVGDVHVEDESLVVAFSGCSRKRARQQCVDAGWHTHYSSRVWYSASIIWTPAQKVHTASRSIKV